MAVDTVQTPCTYFNLISGGLRFSTLVECWGANQSGKSTFCYQTISNFLNEYPNGKFKLITPEGQADEMRLKYGFKIPLNRIDMIAAPTVEEGFYLIGESVKKSKTPTMILWDTISATPTKSSFDSQKDAKDASNMSMYSGGRQDRPRVIKHYLRNLLSLIYEKPVIILLPNQVFASMDMYGPAEVSGEGSALKHDLHYSFHFKTKNSEVTYDEKTGLAESTIVRVELTKSKLCPKFQWKPIYIDNASGGIIDPMRSLALTAYDLGVIFTIKDPTDGRRNTYATGEEPSENDVTDDKGVVSTVKDYSKTIILGRDWEVVQSDVELIKKVERVIMRRLLQNNFIIKMTYMEDYDKADYVNELLADPVPEKSTTKVTIDTFSSEKPDEEVTDHEAGVANLIEEAKGPS